MSLAKLFVWFWKKSEILPKNPDVIVAICYGVLPDRLADGTLAALQKALELTDRFPNAVLAFGNAAICFPGSEIVEHDLKMKILGEKGFPTERIVEAPVIYNSVTEAWEIREALAKTGVSDREVCIVAAEAHSRSVLYIYRRVFPRSRLSLVHIPFETEYQPDHTVTLQTGPWLWIVANILRQSALRILGLERVGKIRHHTKVR